MTNPYGALNDSFQWLLKREPQSLNDLIRTAKLAGLTPAYARKVVDRLCLAGLATSRKDGKEIVITWRGGDV